MLSIKKNQKITFAETANPLRRKIRNIAKIKRNFKAGSQILRTSIKIIAKNKSKIIFIIFWFIFPANVFFFA